MKKPVKLMILLACAFLLAVFFVPIWHIQLNAPQYPGGLDMYIWINKITGTDEFTIQNINILNHYIGMQAITPESFKELKIMPYVVVFFIIAGIATAFLKNKKILLAWFIIMVVGGTIGLIDFYMWQQAFGNELDPAAPIKVEGMSYSPPFIGSKVLLNIEAISYPALGGLFFGIALLLAALACLKSFNFSKKTKVAKNHISSGLATACILLLFSSCEPQPKAIEYGFDSCEHCRMTISDNRYGSELVTQKGKVYKFDAIECLTAFQEENKKEAAMLLVTDFTDPEKFIDAQEAWFLQSKALPSPMGMNLNAFKEKATAEKFQQEHDGKLLTWEEISKLNMGGINN